MVAELFYKPLKILLYSCVRQSTYNSAFLQNNSHTCQLCVMLYTLLVAFKHLVLFLVLKHCLNFSYPISLC